MSFPDFTMQGDIHPCYLLMNQLKKCHTQHLYAATKCTDQRQDFFECHNRAKQNAFLREAEDEIRKAKVINVPHYNRATDSFTFDDGRVVSNTDPMFQKFAWV